MNVQDSVLSKNKGWVTSVSNAPEKLIDISAHCATQDSEVYLVYHKSFDEKESRYVTLRFGLGFTTQTFNYNTLPVESKDFNDLIVLFAQRLGLSGGKLVTLMRSNSPW
jgi:hypothetical protein